MRLISATMASLTHTAKVNTSNFELQACTHFLCGSESHCGSLSCSHIGLMRCVRPPRLGSQTLDTYQHSLRKSHPSSYQETHDRSALGDLSCAHVSATREIEACTGILVAQVERLVPAHCDECPWGVVSVVDLVNCMAAKISRDGVDGLCDACFSRPGHLRRRARVHFSELECRNRHLNREPRPSEGRRTSELEPPVIPRWAAPILCPHPPPRTAALSHRTPPQGLDPYT